MQRDLTRLSKGKYKALHLGWNKHVEQYRLGSTDWQGRSFASAELYILGVTETVVCPCIKAS